MRMILTGSLSQSCHPTLTLLIPPVTQGAAHNARRTINSHLPELWFTYLLKHTLLQTHRWVHSRRHGMLETAHKHTNTPWSRGKLCVCVQFITCSCMMEVEQMEDKEHRSFQTFNGMTWLQRGSEARHTDIGGVFGLSHSLEHHVLLTFCLRKYKGGLGAQIHLILALCSTGWRLVQVFLANSSASFNTCVLKHVRAGSSKSAFFYPPPECCSREVIVNCASLSDTSDQKHYQMTRQ